MVPTQKLHLPIKCWLPEGLKRKIATLRVFVWIISEAVFLRANNVFIPLIFTNFESGKGNQNKVSGQQFLVWEEAAGSGGVCLCDHASESFSPSARGELGLSNLKHAMPSLIY